MWYIDPSLFASWNRNSVSAGVLTSPAKKWETAEIRSVGIYLRQRMTILEGFFTDIILPPIRDYEE
jgi:hypothetical protein